MPATLGTAQVPGWLRCTVALDATIDMPVGASAAAERPGAPSAVAMDGGSLMAHANEFEGSNGADSLLGDDSEEFERFDAPAAGGPGPVGSRPDSASLGIEDDGDIDDDDGTQFNDDDF